MLIPILSAVAPAAPELSARIAARVLFTPHGRRTSARGNAFLATGERKDYAIARQKIATWKWGDGPRVLCMHGWGGSAAQFASIVPALTSRGYSVVAIDGPGHGHSSGRDSSIPAMRDVLIELAKDAAMPVSIVAHSGGAVAATLAMQGGVAVDRLVFVGPTVDPGFYMEQFALAAGFSRGLLERVKRRTTISFGMPWTGLRILPVAATRSEPLLVVHDRQDEEVPWREGADIAATWPNARLLTTEGLGHRRVLYDAGVADAIAAFVDLS